MVAASVFESTPVAIEITVAKKTSRSPQQPPKVSLNVKIASAIKELLEDFVKASKPRTSQGAVVEWALERYFRAEGVWPSGKKDKGPVTPHSEPGH